MESAAWIPPTTTVPFKMEVDDHPPYAEMIYRAIEALKEKDGSSKKAIDKYIKQVYGDRLRHTHPTLLTRHLNHLSSAGLLLLININNNNNSYNYKLPSTLPYPPPPPPTIVVDPVVPPGTARSPPPKPNGLKRGPGRPPKIHSSTVAVVGKPKNPVGRPKGSKRGGQKKVGDDADLIMRRLEHFQSKVKESLDVLKPYFNHESPVTAIAAIKELETLATLDLKTPLLTHEVEQQYLQIPLFQPHTSASTSTST